MEILRHLRAFSGTMSLSMYYEGPAGTLEEGTFFAFRDNYPPVEETLRASHFPAVYTVSPEHMAFARVNLPDGGRLFLGPACPQTVEDFLLDEMLAYVGKNREGSEAFGSWLQRLPRRDLGHFLDLVHYLCLTCFDLDVADWRYVDYPPPCAARSAGKVPTPGREEAPPDAYYEYRRLFSLAVEYGKVDELKGLLSRMYQVFGMTPSVIITEEELREKVIISLARTSEAALRGGLGRMLDDEMMKGYLQSLRNTNGMRPMVRLMKTMMTEYTIRVRQTRMIPGDDILIAKICRDIEEHLYDRISTRDIAERLGYHTTYISNHFKTVSGQTLSGYINRRKVDEARYLLEKGQTSVTEIAMKLGFTTPNYFSAVFRKMTGETPGSYLR